MLLHDLEELDHDLGGRAEQDLAFPAALGVGDGEKSVVQNGHENHDEIGFLLYTNVREMRL